jgi:hypothetical protein
MTKLITRVGDRVLGALLATREAGACVPEMGQWCACITDTSRQPGTGYCRSDHRWVYFQFDYKLDCYGRCTRKQNTVCGHAESGQYC